MKELLSSPLLLILISFQNIFCPSFCLTSKSLYCATSTYPGRPSVSRKSRRWVMAIFPTPRLVLTEEDSLKTHSLGSMCSRTDAGKHTWKSHRNESADFTDFSTKHGSLLALMLKDVKNNTFTRTGLDYCPCYQFQLSYHRSPMNSGFKGDNNSTVHHYSNTICVMFAKIAQECAFKTLKSY